MKNIDWKSKLTSRKFWAAIVSAVASIAVAFGASDGTITQITAIIMAGATVIAYIIGEGLVDASRNKAGTGDSKIEDVEQKQGTVDEPIDKMSEASSEAVSDTKNEKLI